MQSTNLTKTETNHNDVFEAAYNELLPSLRALEPSELTIVNLDIPAAVTTVLGALPEIRALRPDVVKNLPFLDIERFDKLESYARALSHAHALYLAASHPSDDLHALCEEGAKLRDTLLKDAEALANRGFLDGERFAELKGPIGYKNLAVDLQVLTAMFRQHWSDIEGRTGVQPSELERAVDLTNRILTTVGLREQAPVLIAASADVRQRAFTTFMRTYDHVRRAITFLRWDEGDVDQITPSLYAGRSNGRKKEKATEEQPANGPAVPATPGGGGAAAAPGAPPGGGAVMPTGGNGAAPTLVPSGNGVPIGWPGSSPFTQ
jgi:hypothetical protein